MLAWWATWLTPRLTLPTLSCFSFLSEAVKYGLLSKVVSEDKLEQEVNAIANKIVSLSQPVVALGKTCFYSQTVKGRDQAYVWVSISKKEVH